jgi:energy-coupling factor transport system permease protein
MAVATADTRTGRSNPVILERGRGRAFHPAAWICWATCAGIVTFMTTNPFYLALVIATAWLVYATHRVPGPTARAFRIFLIAGLMAMTIRTLLVFFGTVNAENVAFAALEGMRLATLLVVFGTFNAVTDAYGVVRLAPRRFHEPALAAALALSIAPRTISMVGRVREAQELRGIRVSAWRGIVALAVPVLETGMEEAVTLAESMDSRGHGRGTRSRYRPERWTPPAIAISGAAVCAATILLVASFWGASFWATAFGSPGLHPSTAPLVWPAADPVLILGIGLLAVPGLFPPHPLARPLVSPPAGRSVDEKGPA